MDNENQNSKGYVVSSIIGEGATFNGDIELSGLLRIDGDLLGAIKNDDRILVGSSGRIQGKIYSGTVIVGGVVKGEIYAESKVVILSSGLVLGDIHSSTLVMEKGALLDGNCSISKDAKVRNQRNLPSDNYKLDWDKFSKKSNTTLDSGRR
ncbi:MAG: polymer-forming cytoskeletal protein [Spirochaetaceae bacterium]|jgi:cytoskeletal protein CcmA (bactofilin family)|nr:polymer-forming cytoskeletal protein [Spirochaetaceae bacterium]